LKKGAKKKKIKKIKKQKEKWEEGLGIWPPHHIIGPSLFIVVYFTQVNFFTLLKPRQKSHFVNIH
jgi:hypothetical protein